MTAISRFCIATAALFCAVSAKAHEGHAAIGTIYHEIEHAAWMAAALMFGSVMILLVFSVSVRFADRHLTRPAQRDEVIQRPDPAQRHPR